MISPPALATPFTTDSASLQAIEVNAEVMLKATKVDGIYCGGSVHAIPRRCVNDRLDLRSEALAAQAMVMDATAIMSCRKTTTARKLQHQSPRDLVRSCGESVGTTVVRE